MGMTIYEVDYLPESNSHHSPALNSFQVLTDKRPFHEHKSWAVILQIIKGTMPKKPDFTTSRGYTEEIWELTTTCWRQDPTKRPTVDKLLESLSYGALQWKPRSAEPSR